MEFDLVSYMMGAKAGGGRGSGSAATYGELFKYMLLSTSQDLMTRNDRWYRRSSSEPVIIMSASFFTDEGAMSYTGYSVIGFDSSGIAGTASAQAAGLGSPRTGVTPSGTTFYIQQMIGMYPPTAGANKMKIQFGTDRANTLEFVIDNTKIVHVAESAEFTGDPALVSALYSLIDNLAV